VLIVQLDYDDAVDDDVDIDIDGDVVAHTPVVHGVDDGGVVVDFHYDVVDDFDSDVDSVDSNFHL